jgi:hypothetical protein
MSRSRITLGLLSASVLFAGASFLFPADSPEVDPDEQLLAKARISIDGPGLLAHLRKVTLTDEECRQVQALIRQLGDSSFAKREQATKTLVARGLPVLLFTRQALRDPDLEVARRAERVIDGIRAADGKAGRTSYLTASVIRLLAKKQPDGAIEALLRYLPFADDESMEEETLGALVAIATRPNRNEPYLLTALEDPFPSRRGGAAYVVGRLADTNQRSAAFKLLHDRDAKVRLRAAQGLLAGKEKAAIPVFLALLAENQPEIVVQAEETLILLAGEEAPNLLVSDRDEAGRQRYREAWATWWREHESKIDLVKLEQRPQYLGLTLVVQMDSKRIWECGRDGRPRWMMENLGGPIDAQVLSGGRVLVAEFQAHRVTERDMKGNILWEKAISNPVSAERLANGNTFIASYAGVMEVTRDGKEVYNYRPTASNVYGAQRLRNGHIVCVTLEGKLYELEASTGKTLRTIQMDVNNCYSVDALPGGRFLVTSYNQGKVAEVDGEGKLVWDHAIPGAYHAVRLMNGNTLVSSHSTKQIIEVNRQGKRVWETQVEGHVWRVHRR